MIYRNQTVPKKYVVRKKPSSLLRDSDWSPWQDPCCPSDFSTQRWARFAPSAPTHAQPP